MKPTRLRCYNCHAVTAKYKFLTLTPATPKKAAVVAPVCVAVEKCKARADRKKKKAARRRAHLAYVGAQQEAA
jgi:hypothetical protein